MRFIALAYGGVCYAIFFAAFFIWSPLWAGR